MALLYFPASRMCCARLRGALTSADRGAIGVLFTEKEKCVTRIQASSAPGFMKDKEQNSLQQNVLMTPRLRAGLE